MTFAASSSNADHVRSSCCDCDECDATSFSNNVTIPETIKAAIRAHKKQRLSLGEESTSTSFRTFKRTQQRTLIGRHNTISVWNITMPLHAEPLIEYGNNHRIVWIKRLPGNIDNNNNNEDANDTTTSSVLQSIGKGIIGSSDEEKTRTDMIEWNENDFIFIPSNGGKAVGWIHTTTTTGTTKGEKDDTKTYSNTSGYAVLYVAKIPIELLEEQTSVDDESVGKDGDKNSIPQWTKPMIESCREGLIAILSTNEDDIADVSATAASAAATPYSIHTKINPYYKFPKSKGEILKQAFQQAETYNE